MFADYCGTLIKNCAGVIALSTFSAIGNVHRRFHEFALRDKDRAFALATGLHAVALIVAAAAIVASVLGAGTLP
jgi:hypothetical protein